MDLALETSTRGASLAIHRAGQTISTTLEASAAHASDLLPSLVEMLDTNGLRKEDIERIHVGIGPGSFTGLRVGAAIALGLARGIGAELVAVPSVEASAWNALEVGEFGHVVLDARSGAVYVASYLKHAAELEEVLAPTRVMVGEAESFELRPGCYVGDARGSDWFGSLKDSEFRGVDRPDAEALLAVGMARWRTDGASLEKDVRPLYLAGFGE